MPSKGFYILLFAFLYSPFLWSGVMEEENPISIQGRVVDETGEPIPGTTVYIHELQRGTYTDQQGYFELGNLRPGTYHFHVTSVGYASLTQTIRIQEGMPALWFEMEATSIELAETIIEANPFKSGPVEQAQTIISVDQNFLEKNLGNSFVNSLEKLPGVSSINTGVGIAKPVIRGMAFNRVMVNDHGIKQEGQQWGADHGLEIDQFDVERVEVVKGPSSLLYGSDGIAGVINIQPAKLPEDGTLRGEVFGVGKTNNDLYGGSVKVEGNKKGWVFRGRYSHQDFGNYRVPATNFTYAGFVLPIFDERLKNTAGREQNFSFTGGLKKDWGYSTVRFSSFDQEVGLFAGAVGRPRAYQLGHEDGHRNIGLPRQHNRHLKVISNTNVKIGDDWLEMDLAYQRNIREERSRPGAHNIADEGVGNLALGMDLPTFTANARYHHQVHPKISNIYGFQAQRMENFKDGFEFLIAEFRSHQAGFFTYSEFKQRKGLTWSGGLRWDMAMHDIDEHRQPLYTNRGEPTGNSLLLNEDFERRFGAFSGALGGSWVPAPKMNVKLNLGSSFRFPTAIELSSNGFHHGTFRTEVGNPDLQSERGYQIDLNYTYTSQSFRFSLTPFFNYFDNYIYLAPTGRASRLPFGGFRWEYMQTEAIFAGGESIVEFHPVKNLHLSLSTEYVWNRNLVSTLPLPLTPPIRNSTEIEYTLPFKVSWLKEPFLGFTHHWVGDQSRVDRNERVTEGYHLMAAQAGVTLNVSGQPFIFMLSVQNLADVYYLNHLSRYRLLNLPEQGRNFIFTLKIPFSTSF